MDLASLQRQYNQKAQERKNTERQIAKLKEKLEKLKLAYTRMSGWKSEYRNLRTSVDKTGNSTSYWRGANYNGFRKMYGEVTAENKKVHNQIDRILDDINWKINEVEDEIARQQSILGGLLNGLRTIKTAIENWAN